VFSVRLFAFTEKPHVQTSRDFLYLLPVAVAHSSSGVMYFRFCGWRHVCLVRMVCAL